MISNRCGTRDYFGFDEEDLRHNTAAFSRHLKSLNMAFEPSDGLVLCSTDIGEASLNRDGYIAQAAALEVAQIMSAKAGISSVPKLPAMDVPRFLAALAELIEDDVTGVSLALVGYERFRHRPPGPAERHGVCSIGHVTTDLHEAAKWRNEPASSSRTSLRWRAGRYPGVSTLAHFPQRQPPHPCDPTARMGANRRRRNLHPHAPQKRAPRSARRGTRNLSLRWCR